MPFIFRILKAPVDVIITLILWTYFLFGYIIFYIPVLLLLSLFAKDRESLFQKINNVFYRGFFFLMRCITPGLTIRVSDEIASIRSAIVVSNHRSYLDPLIMISLFPKHKTVVKGIFFRIPVMRWVMKSGGYIPFAGEGESKDLMLRGIERMPAFFKGGGVLFIFPEGRRSRDGRLGMFQKGAFSLAERNGVPVEMLYIENTNRLFTPGRFFFNTCIKNTITVEKIGSIDPSRGTRLSSREMRDRALELYRQRGAGTLYI